MGRECSAHEEEMKAHRILAVKSEGKRSLERPVCMFEINTKIDI
jgi:hypothetical protein